MCSFYEKNVNTYITNIIACRCFFMTVKNITNQNQCLRNISNAHTQKHIYISDNQNKYYDFRPIIVVTFSV